MICKKILQVTSNQINNTVTFNFDTNTNKIVLVSQDGSNKKVLPLGEMKNEGAADVNITLNGGTGITIGNDNSINVNTTWLDNVIAGKGFAQASAVAAITDQISTFALKSELPIIPTGLSQFENDADYAKLSDIPAIPTGLSQLTNDAEIAYVSGVPVKVSDLQNDAGYLVQDNLSGYAPISTLPSVEGLASEEYVDGKLSGYLKIEDYKDDDTKYTAGEGLKLENGEFSLTAAIPSIEGLASETYVDTKLEDYLRVEDYVDTDTTYTAGEGLQLSGNEFSLTAAIPTKVSDLVNDLGFTTEDSFLKSASYVKAFVNGDNYVEISNNMTTEQVYAAKETIGVIDPEVTTGEQLIAKYSNMFGRYLKLVFATKDNVGTETTSNAIYIDVNELFDSYTGGNGIAVDNDTNTISLTAAMPVVPTKVSEFNNDKGYVTLNDLEQVKTTLLEYMNPSNVITYESIDGDVNAPDKSIYVEQEDTLTANTSFTGKNITVQELTNENSYTRFTATGDITISNMDNSGTLPKATSNAQVSINTPGRVVITNSDLAQNGYNAIEIGLNSAVEPPKSVLIDGITFGGNLSNNAITIFGTADDAVITVSNCTFTKVSNVLRLSNRTNKKVTVNFVNCQFTEWQSGAWAGIVLCQDYTNMTSAAVAEANLFAPDKVTINIINCTHAGTKIAFEDPAEVCASADEKQLLYVYADHGSAANKATLIAYDPAKYPTITAV